MKDGIILWEAHRAGAGGVELPESCIAAFEYGWELGGRPEADVNVTSDGVLVSLHDRTLDRIAQNLPEHLKGRAVSEMTWEELKSVDIGWEDFPDQHVTDLATLFSILQKIRQIFLCKPNEYYENSKYILTSIRKCVTPCRRAKHSVTHSRQRKKPAKPKPFSFPP